MISGRDWLPRNHEALYDKAKQTVQYLADPVDRVRLGFAATTPQGIWLDETFMPAYDAFINAYDAWKSPSTRTVVLTATLNDAQAAFVVQYRKLYTGFLKENPIVTNADLVSMGLPERNSSGRTPTPVPSTVPESEVRLPSPAVVEIHFRDSGADSKGKPAGVHGAEIAWALLDTPPTGWTQLINSSFDTHTPFNLSFAGEERGKHLYFALRWENTRGEKGPWSAIQNVIVP
jgi:hypothetical protein